MEVPRGALVGAALALLLLPAWLPAHATPEASPKGLTIADEALAFAAAHRAAWGVHPDAVLEVAATHRSLTADHAWLVQRLGGALVQDGGLAYHRPLDGAPPLVQVQFASLARLPPPPLIGRDTARTLALTALGAAPLRAPPTEDLVLSPDGALAWRIAVPLDAPPRDREVRLDARSGLVLGVRDLALRAEGVGSVFLTNPIVQSGDGRLRDHPLGLSTPDIAAQVRDVALQGLSEAPGERGRLVGPYVAVLGAAFSPDLDFRYPREDPRFEEVMAYHHTDAAQRFLQGLGFTDASHRQVAASNYPGEVNAFYSRLTRTIHFGYHARDLERLNASGVADAAEDGEVVVHEYGHAVLDDMVPGLGGPAGEAVHEAFADFLSVSVLSRSSGGRFDACIAEWMSQYIVEGNPPCIRRLDTGRRFPEHFNSGVLASPHENGLIWAGVLYDLHQALPPGDVARVAIEAHTYLASVPKMPDLGTALLEANTRLGAPLPEAAVRAALDAHGLLPVAARAPQDDARSGADAGGNFGTALPLAAGAYQGRVGAQGDREDWFRLDLREGDFLVLDVDPGRAGTPGLVPPTDPPVYGLTAASAMRVASPAFRVLGPVHGCGAGAADLRFVVRAEGDEAWRLYLPEPPDNDPIQPTEATYRFAWRIERDLEAVMPEVGIELAAGTINASAEDDFYVRLDGPGSATIIAPSGRSMTVRKDTPQGVAIAHVALDGRVLGVRRLTGAPATITTEGSLAGEPADGTWYIRKAMHENTGLPLGVQLRVQGKVLDDVSPVGDPIEGSGTATSSAILGHLAAWNWHRAPPRFDASSNDTTVPRPPVSPLCPRLLTS